MVLSHYILIYTLVLKVGLAVGTAEKAHKNAEFKEIELQVSCYSTKETVQLSNNNNTYTLSFL